MATKNQLNRLIFQLPVHRRSAYSTEGNVSMNLKFLVTLVLAATAINTAWAGPYKWTSDWAQGVTEHRVDDGNGNELNISCPDDDTQSLSAFATIAGKQYASSDSNGGGFDVIVDGKVYSNPFNIDCEVCSDIFKNDFYPALRKANNVQLSAGGKTVNVPTANLKKVLLPLNSKNNACRAAW
jgi:hypothetical protein